MEKKHKIILGLLFFLLLGAMLRFHHIGLRTFWLDEAASTNLVRYNFSELWRQVAVQDSSPAYIYLVKAWAGVFGNSELSVRSISAIFGLLSIAAVYFLGKLLFSRRAGLWASFLLAVNYFSLFYSIQARPYSMAIFLSIFSYYWFAWLLKGPRSPLAAALYIFFTTAGIYTHIWFFLLLGSQGLFWLGSYFKKKASLIFALYFFLIAIFSLPWTLAVIRYGNNRGIESYGSPGLSAFWETFRYFMFGSVLAFLVISLFAFLAGLFEVKKEPDGENIRYRLVERAGFSKIGKNNFLLLNYLFAPLAVAWVVSQWAPIYVTGRHEAVVLPAFVLLVANLWSGIGNKKWSILFGAVLAVLAFQSVEAEKRTIESYAIDDRTIAEDLLGDMQNGDFIVFTGLSRPTFDYYLPKLNPEKKEYREISYPAELEAHPGYEIIGDMMKDETELNRQLGGIVSEAGAQKPENIWVINSSTNPVNKLMRDKFDGEFELAETRRIGAGASPLHYDEILRYGLKNN